jgi:hypothetical protein
MSDHKTNLDAISVVYHDPTCQYVAVCYEYTESDNYIEGLGATRIEALASLINQLEDQGI